MKRIALVAVAAVLLGFPATALAAPVGTCPITPLSGPAGSTFTATCSGWGANEVLNIGWLVDQPNGNTVWSAGGAYPTDSSGNLTVSQVVPVAGQGHFHALPPQNYRKVPKTGFVGYYSDFIVTP